MEKTEKLHKTILYSVIASESIHIFCCVLPTIFSVLSLLAGVGMIGVMPGFVVEGHELIHAYEIPMIIVSGMILLFGWGIYAYSRKLDCRTKSSCCHEPCSSQKNRTKIVMILASCLFLFNLAIYFGLHRGQDEHFHEGADHAIIHHHDEAHHDDHH